MAHKLRLVSFETCPYVERSRIVLHEKKLEHELTFIDLSHKPDWFLRISPMGKVPVLLVDERPVFESMVINELLEELYPDIPMLPAQPLDRADARAWIVYCNDSLMTQGFKAQLALATGGKADAAAPLEIVRAALDKVERELERRGGQFFLSDDFTLVDATYAPFLRRWKASETWQDTPLLASVPKLAAYTETLLSRPSVTQADPGDVGPKLKTLLIEKYGPNKKSA